MGLGGHSSCKEGVSAVLSAGVYLPAQSQLPALEPRVLWLWLCELLAFMEEVGRVAASFCSLAPLVAHPWPEPRSSGTLPLTVSLLLQSVHCPPPNLSPDPPHRRGPSWRVLRGHCPSEASFAPLWGGRCGEPSPCHCSPR